MPHDSVRASIAEVAAYLLANDRYIFTTHLTPDGDGLGSQLALLRFLRGLKKDVRIINCSSVPEDMRFLARAGEIVTFQKEKHVHDLQKTGAIVAFDLGATGRLGRMEEPVKKSPAHRILIDHHLFDNDIFDKALVLPDYSSSAEITYDVIKACGGKMTLELAEPLYVGFVQDTGSFAYNSTSPRVHRIAAEFLECGVNPHRIWKKLNCQKPLKRVRLTGISMSRIAMSADGKVASVNINLDHLEHFEGEARDAFEVVHHLLTIQGVEVGFLALQIGTNRTKFSLRSAGHFDVCAIAKDYIGGGHRYAAGCTVDDMDPEAAYQMILDRVVRMVAGQKSERPSTPNQLSDE